MTLLYKRLGALLLFLCLLAAAPAVARADQLTVDFETGPTLRTPVQDEYAAADFVRFPQDPGFRPYRTEVAADRAHSGTVVADVGTSVCFPETGDASGCENADGGTFG